MLLPYSAQGGEGRREARTPVNHRIAPLGATQTATAAPLREHALGLAIAIAVLPDVAVALRARHAHTQALADTTSHDIAVECEPLECFIRAGGNPVWESPWCMTGAHCGKPCMILCCASTRSFC